MGAWGTRIYEDDTALDLRGDFLERKDNGEDVASIEQAILAEYLEDDTPENNDVVRLALCWVELETGTLTDATKKAAIEVIESGRQYDHWLKEAGKEDAALRKRELTLILKYINGYTGAPVKRKSWVELQKGDVEFEEESAEKLDDASWHDQDSDEADDDKALMLSGAHIASFVYWLITRGYFNATDAATKKDIEAVKAGKKTADWFVLHRTDSKLWDQDATKNVRDFVSGYYANDYVDDYEQTVLQGKELYHYLPTKQDHERLAKIIDNRLVTYKQDPSIYVKNINQRKLPKTFWFWLLLCIGSFYVAIRLFMMALKG